MQKAFVLPEVYPCHWNEDGTVSFTTQHGIVYSAYFLDGSGYFSAEPALAEHAFMFGFEKPNATTTLPEDDRIGVTIAALIKDYLAQNPHHILLAVYQQNDLRQASRARKFLRWESKFGVSKISKLDWTIGEGKEATFLTMMFHTENEHASFYAQQIEYFVAGEKP